MARRSIQTMAAQLAKASDAALQGNQKLADMARELGNELQFRSSVAGLLEQYRQELISGKPRHTLKEITDRVEAFFVVQAMKEVEGNIAQAAELLGIPEATLRYKLGKHGLR